MVDPTSDMYASSFVEDDAILRFRYTKFKLRLAVLVMLCLLPRPEYRRLQGSSAGWMYSNDRL